MYEHNYTVSYEFDTQNVTESDTRDIIRRHYDFTRWCEENAKGKYHVYPQYRPAGITVSFELEEDCSNFMDFSANCYWIFLHN